MIPGSDLLHMKSERCVLKNIVNDFPFSGYKYAVKGDIKTELGKDVTIL